MVFEQLDLEQIQDVVQAKRANVLFHANVGMRLSAGELSNWLIQDWPALHAKKVAIYKAGWGSSPWHRLDYTVTQVNGQSKHCHVERNPLHTVYCRMAHKDWLTIVDVLSNLGARTFRGNAETIYLLRIFRVAQCTTRRVQGLPHDQDWREAEFTALLDAHLSSPRPQHRARIL